MPTLKVNVEENSRPLRRTYVEHLIAGIGDKMYMTDDTGRVRSEGGDDGINSFTNNADIRVLCQNSVVKVLDGGIIPVPLAVNQDKSIVDNDTVNLNTNAEQDDHYEILSRCLLAYDVVFRQFRPFSNANRQKFPLRRRSSLRETKDQARRIEVSFPSQFPLGDVAFVEPKSIATGFPLVHFRTPTPQNGRLFGENGFAPTLIPGELAHALHFSLFSEAKRETIQNDYIGWIASDLATGGNGRHAMGRRSSPMVAYLEAFDHFAGRFAEFVRVRVQGATTGSTMLRQQEITEQIRQDFVTSELSGAPVTGIGVATLTPPSVSEFPLGPAGGATPVEGVMVGNLTTGIREIHLPGTITVRSPGGIIVPNPTFNGSDDEGSIYGCIFVDFARRVGLHTAVNAFLQSASAGALTFGEYKTFIADNRPQNLPDLEAAQQMWRL